MRPEPLTVFFSICRRLIAVGLRCAIAAWAIGLVMIARANSPATVRTVAEIRSIPEWDLRRAHPLRLEGTLTLVDAERRLIVLQDATGALGLKLDREFGLTPGRRIAVSSTDSWPYLAALPEYPSRPSGRDPLSTFEVTPLFSGNYVARIRGFLLPPATGEYRFWIASDDTSELWLSADDTRGASRLIAAATSWTGPREWNRLPSQRSAVIQLEAGRRYYIEAVHEQRGGGDHLAVSWSGPGVPQAIIDGRYLQGWADSPANAAPGSLLREYWLDHAVEHAGKLSGPRTLDSTIVLSGAAVQDLGEQPMPAPRMARPGEPSEVRDDFTWREMEGTVEFVGHRGRTLVIELADEDGRTRVVLQPDASVRAALSKLHGRRVRVRGVGESALEADGRRVLANLWSPSASAVSLVDEWPRADQHRTTTIAELVAGGTERFRDQPVKIRGRLVGVAADGRVTLQDQGSFQGSTSEDGDTWRPLGPPVEVPMGETVEAGLMVASRSAEKRATAVFEHVEGLSGELAQARIGEPMQPGTLTRHGSDRFTISGSGHDAWNKPDQFFFVHRKLTGAGEIVAQLASFDAIEGWAKAGIMIRDSLAPDASFVDLVQTGGNGCCVQWRRVAEGSAPRSAEDYTLRAPLWLKLSRTFNTIVVRPTAPLSLPAGAMVEAIGYMETIDGHPVLGDASLREVASTTDTALSVSETRPLVEIARLRGASGNVDRFDVLKVRGVVTFAGEVGSRPYVAVQDHTGAAFLAGNAIPRVPRVRVGDYVEIHSNPGWVTPSPDLTTGSIFVLGTAQLPKAIRHPAQYGLPRRGEAAWIEVEGIVRAVSAQGLLQLRADDESFTARVSGCTPEQLRGFIDGVVRLRGALAFPSEHERLLLVPGMEHINVVSAPPEQPFALPSQTIAEQASATRLNRARHRVRVRGTVTSAGQDFFHVQDETGGARVTLAGGGAPFRIGEIVDVVGFPDVAAGREQALVEAMVRRAGGVAEPRPLTATVTELSAENRIGRLIRLEATVVRSRPLEQGHSFELQRDGRTFRALLPPAIDPPAVLDGSLVEVTGVCVAERGVPAWSEDAGAGSVLPVAVLLRSVGDLVVRQKPRGWALRQTLLGVGGFLILAAVTGAWIHALRRRVAQRTAELRTAMDRLQRETQTAATLAERNRLAGEIHDSLEQGFSGVILQLETTAKLSGCPPEVRAGLGMARRMVAFSRTEIRHAVWDLQSPVLAEADLGTALQQILSQVAPDSLQARLVIEGTARRLSSAVEHHVLRIAQEAIANAVKHAEAKRLDVQLSFSPAELRLAVRDDGRGFVPDHVLGGGLGHFGLRSLRGRASKISSTLTISSAPGRGTSIDLKVPLTESTI